MKEIKQKQLACYGHVQRMAEGRSPKIALNWMQEEKEDVQEKCGWKVYEQP